MYQDSLKIKGTAGSDEGKDIKERQSKGIGTE
jgi:hypothetical protein